MFTIEDYLSGPFFDEKISFRSEIKKGVEEEFLIRRLDGEESIKVEMIEGITEKYIYVLAHCLLDGKSHIPIGDEQARKFLRQYRGAAISVGVKIFQETRKLDETESETLEESEKNLEKTDTPSSTDNGVPDTDKTPNQPDQANENS